MSAGQRHDFPMQPTNPWDALTATVSSAVRQAQEIGEKHSKELSEIGKSIAVIQNQLGPDGIVAAAKVAINMRVDSLEAKMEGARRAIQEQLEREIGAHRTAINDQGRALKQLQDDNDRDLGALSTRVQILEHERAKIKWYIAGVTGTLTFLWAVGWWLFSNWVKLKGGLP